MFFEDEYFFSEDDVRAIIAQVKIHFDSPLPWGDIEQIPQICKQAISVLGPFAPEMEGEPENIDRINYYLNLASFGYLHGYAQEEKSEEESDEEELDEAEPNEEELDEKKLYTPDEKFKLPDMTKAFKQIISAIKKLQQRLYDSKDSNLFEQVSDALLLEGSTSPLSNQSLSREMNIYDPTLLIKELNELSNLSKNVTSALSRGPGKPPKVAQNEFIRGLAFIFESASGKKATRTYSDQDGIYSGHFFGFVESCYQHFEFFFLDAFPENKTLGQMIRTALQ